MSTREICFLNFTPTKAISYSLPESYLIYGSVSRKKRSKLPKFSSVKGVISSKSKKRLFNAFDWLRYIAREKKAKDPKTGRIFTFRLSFITLTLSDTQRHSDKFVKNNMLSPFLEALKKRYPKLSYIWKAETQDNGNIHFHITTDHFIPLSYVQQLWNRQQRKYGYLDNYCRIYHKFNAPSTEIKAVRNDNQVLSYFNKYFAKSYTDDDIKKFQESLEVLKTKLFKVHNKDIKLNLMSEIRRLEKKISEAKRRKVNGAIWDSTANIKSNTFTLSELDLPSDANKILNSLQKIYENEHCRILKINNIKKLMYQLGITIYDSFMQLVKKIDLRPPIYNMIYCIDKNYRYSI